MVNPWPLVKDRDAFYGNPRGRNGQPSLKWESQNLVRLTPPFQMYYDHKPIKSIRIHRKIFDALGRIFATCWEKSGRQQKVIDEWGLSVFGGSYNYRLIRGSASNLSNHSYGAAIDLDPERNAMHDKTPHFALCKEVLDAFEYEYAYWGNNFHGRPDAMHWEFVRYS